MGERTPLKVRRATCEERLARLVDGYNALADRWEQANERAEKAEASLSELVEALRFYADSATWARYTHSGDPWFYTQVLTDDEGKRARLALAAADHLTKGEE